jgi:cytochrome c-type biogenesis protein CcmH
MKMSKGRPGALPLDPAKDKSLEPDYWFRDKINGVWGLVPSGVQGRSPWPLLALVLLISPPAFAVSDPTEMLQDPRQEARAEAIGSQLRCLVCQNESIEDSQAPLAHDLRQKVREQVVAGRTNQQVIDWMVARYGTFVRLRPPLMASTIMLYATPFLGLLVGGLAAWWGRKRAVLTAGPAPLSAAEQAKLRELTGKI